MKNLKFTFLFFVVSSLFMLASCSPKEELNSSKVSDLDTIGFFIQEMKNDSLAIETRLNSANSALQKIGADKSDPRIEDILTNKIYLFGSLKQYDSAIYISKQLIQKSKQDNDSIAIGRNYSILAYYYNSNQQTDSAYYYYNLIKNEYLKYNDSILNGNNLLTMAIIERSFGDNIASEHSGSLALKYFGDKNPISSASVYNNWAISSNEQGELKDALLFYKKAIDLTTSKENSITIKNNIANTYRKLGDYNTSIKILDSLLKDTIVSFTTKARVIDNLAYVKWLAKTTENVLPELEKALEMRLQENDLYGLIASYAHLSTYYENLNTKTAIYYASKMYDVAISQNCIPDQLEALQKLIALDKPVKAKAYYHTYLHLNDSLQNAKQIAKNQFAKIKYDSEKNREENSQLKIISAEKQLEIQKIKTNNILLFTSGSTIFITLLVFIYYKRKKHQIEKRVEVYKTEKRISKKIHDEVANNMVNIMNKIQYTDNSKEALLDDLEKVYLLTRDISHQNNSIETGVHFELFLKSMLTSFNSNTTTVILKDIQKVGLASLTKEKQIELYRILQELMVNMRKHSEATLVAVTFKVDKNLLSVKYSDNGKGLELNELKFKNGLKNIKTRIKSLYGTITFETSMHNGFKAFISFKK
ncbi:tetratricopeptide repeat-containing sensor histidine kinase [Lutibacter sp. HS1-25]|uniref:ATP-binding protein n=1 Tax=Lutibacter sp. HS1-25 TaxID=2485000 RepID=UPI0010120F45|nr:tetratricopeptide repeat-containing sensor histidine kinase [Lutibacter sp. HS1-25]RXP60890.1 tetratricopeptide repeat-containing sensor histidine kinase [Lutibacter sp. HS1-25]